MIFLVAQLVLATEVVACGQIKKGPTDVSLTLPNAIYYPIDVVYLQEAVQLERGQVLQSCLPTVVLLQEQDFQLVVVCEVFVDFDKFLLNVLDEGQDAELETNIACS